MERLALIVIVGVVTSAHYLLRDGQTFGKVIVHHVAYLAVVVSRCQRHDVHVATVAAAAERADDAVLKTLAVHASVPCQVALDVGLHGLEVEVDEVRIDKRSLAVLRRQIHGADVHVGRVVGPVDGVGKVQLLRVVVHVAVELLKHIHKVIVLRSDEHIVAVASHKHATDADMTADVDTHVADHLVRIFQLLIVWSQYLLHGGRIAAAIHVAVNADGVRGGCAVDVDAHPVGKRTPRVDVHNLRCIGGCSERRHGASHRHSIDQRYGF